MYKETFKKGSNHYNTQTSKIESIVAEISKSWGNLGEEIFEIKRTIDSHLENFLPSIKKLYNEHKEAA